MKNSLIISLLLGSTSQLTQKGAPDAFEDSKESWDHGTLKFMDHDDFTTDAPKGYDDVKSEYDAAAQHHNKKASDEEIENQYERAMEMHPKAIHKEETLEDYDPTNLHQHFGNIQAQHLSEKHPNKNAKKQKTKPKSHKGVRLVSRPNIYNYDVQLDSKSIPACTSIECKTETAAKLAPLPPDHPKGYFVPNFGLDHDIIVSQANQKSALSAYGMPTFNATLVPRGIEFELTQLDSNSIPACTSIECKTETAAKLAPLPPGHPKGYFVPNFGLDHDIIVSQANQKSALSAYGMQTFNATKVPRGIEFELTQLN